MDAALAAHADLHRYASLDALLKDPRVAVVDIATWVRGRADLVCRALAAGKHVLAQKPLCLDRSELARIRTAAANAPGSLVAVNLNGRWAPPWKVATSLVHDGAIGTVRAITHLHDLSMQWLPDSERHGSRLYLLFDYMIHWVDISLLWLGGGRTFKVWAHAVTHEGEDELATQIGWFNILSETGCCVSIRSVAAARRYSGHPFTIHGTAGAVRGSVDAPMGGDFVEIDDGHVIERPVLEGNWFPDGFVGSMAELLTAIDEKREPDHGLRTAARSHEVIFAGCQSAEEGGRPIEVILS
jgi:predicted dehydrogenase